MVILADQVERGARTGLPAQRPAQAIFIAPVDLRPVIEVGRIAIALQVIPRRAHGHVLADRHVDHALDLDRIVIAVFDIGRKLGLAQHRRRGTDIDHAPGRVLAEQRALRSAQHFDLRQVVEFAFEQAGRRRQRCIVEVDRGRRFARFADAQIADAANGKAGGCEIGLGKGDVGQRQLQVTGGLDLLLFQRVGVERTDRDRNILQAL